MPDQEDILVRIDGQTHRLRPDDPESLRQIPWAQRKRLMDVLEVMKKAEYVVPDNTTSLVQQQPIDQPRLHSSNKTTRTTRIPPDDSQQSQEHNQISQDSDAMMQRFLAEQKNHKNSLPTKATIYKWFLIIFAIIFLLVLLL